MIKNLDLKIQHSQKRPKMLLLGYTPIIHKRLKNAKNKDKKLKVKTCHMALKIILLYIYLRLLSIKLKKWDANNIIVLLKYLRDDIHWYVQTAIKNVIILY